MDEQREVREVTNRQVMKMYTIGFLLGALAILMAWTLWTIYLM